jgi:hypothetical protein
MGVQQRTTFADGGNLNLRKTFRCRFPRIELLALFERRVGHLFRKPPIPNRMNWCFRPRLPRAAPRKNMFYPIDHATSTATFQALDSSYQTKIFLRPFLGCIGVAPAAGQARSPIVPAEFGGNMDAPEVSPGNTLYPPVNVPGALLYFGDGHAVMGDGEIAGTAIEVPVRARLQFATIKGQHTMWPRFESEHELMAAGIYRPLDDALRIAYTELVTWIHTDYGLSKLDAYHCSPRLAESTSSPKWPVPTM